MPLAAGFVAVIPAMAMLSKEQNPPDVRTPLSAVLDRCKSQIYLINMYQITSFIFGGICSLPLINFGEVLAPLVALNDTNRALRLIAHEIGPHFHPDHGSSVQDQTMNCPHCTAIGFTAHHWSPLLVHSTE